MAAPQQKWEVIEEPDLPAADKVEAQPGVGLDLLLLGLKTVSQRALTAISDLFMLVTMASAWWLWDKIPDPSPTQIVALSIYAAFVLAANWLVRRK